MGCFKGSTSGRGVLHVRFLNFSESLWHHRHHRVLLSSQLLDMEGMTWSPCDSMVIRGEDSGGLSEVVIDGKL